MTRQDPSSRIGRPRPSGTLLGAAFLALLWVGPGCGRHIVIVECPPGTKPVGSECIPLGGLPSDAGVDAGHLADVTSDAPIFSHPDVGGLDAVPDVAVADTVDATGRDEAVDEAGPPEASGPLGAVGATCHTDGDCQGGICLGFPGGYCTQLGCAAGGCPNGSTCVPAQGGNTACLTTCTDTSDCRAGGEQGCKHIPDAGGTLVSVCWGIQADPGAIGAACQRNEGCAGSAVCLSSFPGGYCAITGCKAGSCPSGSACVRFGGVTTCLKTCAKDGDCGATATAPRRCGTLLAVDQSKVQACISGASGKAIGAPCKNDFECVSGTCEILGGGRCGRSRKPCFKAADCGAADVCDLGSANEVGVCTQTCSVQVKCGGSSFCVGQQASTAGSAGSGLCRPSCLGLGEDTDCPGNAGFVCSFGYALGDTSGQGRYLCAMPRTSGLGASCKTDGDCASGHCTPLKNGTGGACTEPCGEGGTYCPFPGTCIFGGATPTCYATCQSAADCAAGATCASAPGALGMICR